MQMQDMPHVLCIEKQQQLHPWGAVQFSDCIQSGYAVQLLLIEGTIVGYFVAMLGYAEVHLLNFTIAKPFERQGWAKVMLDWCVAWSNISMPSHWPTAESIWLEVRASNTRALSVYQKFGFLAMQVRKKYYPNQEDAVVMCLLFPA